MIAYKLLFTSNTISLVFLDLIHKVTSYRFNYDLVWMPFVLSSIMGYIDMLILFSIFLFCIIKYNYGFWFSACRTLPESLLREDDVSIPLNLIDRAKI